MDHANHYYEKILRPYLTSSHPNLFISKDIPNSDATTLKATELQTDSPTGIVIIPEITVTAADTGEGIQVDQYERIFQAFYTTKAAKGTGLGLSIVKRLVEIYEGSITFESQVGKGTTFSIELKMNISR